MQDTNYLRYVISRLAAYPNVWWSAANEYDLFAYNKGNYKCKDKAWKGIVREISTFDRFGHLLGIHQCHKFYDHGDKHITHCSLQRTNLYLTTEETCFWQKKYIKPVVAEPCAMCINPVNWRTDATPAQLHDTITVTLSPEHHVLVLKGYSGDEYPPIRDLLNVGDFHGCEPWLYQECLQRNINARIRAYHNQ